MNKAISTETSVSLEDMVNNTPSCEIRNFHSLPRELAKEGSDLLSAEGIAGIFSIAGTEAISRVTSNPAGLIVAGPIVEKFGFLTWEMMKAGNDFYKDQSKDKWDAPFHTYKGHLDKYWGNLGSNIISDIFGHDLAYGAIMSGLLYANVDPTLSSGISFAGGLVPAVLLKKYGGDLGHLSVKKMSKMQGMKWEEYYEAKCLVIKSADPLSLFTHIGEMFGLKTYSEQKFVDHYYDNKIIQFSEWTGKLRVREVHENDIQIKELLEVVFTLPKKYVPDPHSEYNFFILNKNKGKIDIYNKNVDEVHYPVGFRNRIKNYQKTIEFTRHSLYDSSLAVNLDVVENNGNGPEYIIEIKSFDNKKRIIDAMQEIKNSHSYVTMSTQGKDDVLHGDACAYPRKFYK